MHIYLYVKTHKKTGLKYFGKTTRKDPHKYTGSGKVWKEHLKEYGYDYETEIIFESADELKVKEQGIYYSKLWNIVKSVEWANLKIETGIGGWSGNDGIEPWNKGIPMAEEQKQKIIQTKSKNDTSGKNNPFYGQHHTNATKEKISKANKGQTFSQECIDKRNEKQRGKSKPSVSAKLKGKPKSEEHKQKMRDAWIRRKAKLRPL